MKHVLVVTMTNFLLPLSCVVLLCRCYVVANSATKKQLHAIRTDLNKDDNEKVTDDKIAPLIEYCQFESFNASCPEGYVVLILKALYGRMGLGRCIKSDASLGCHSEVLREMDSRCSGQPFCSVLIPDQSLHETLNCLSDMMAHLQASYKCLPVTQPSENNECDERRPLRFVAPSTGFGHLSSYWMRIYGWSSCPLVINVPSGQRIEIYVLDFSSFPRYRTESDHVERGPRDRYHTEGNSPIDQRQQIGAEEQVLHHRNFQDHTSLLEYCHVYATVMEQDKRKDITVCYGSARETHVYSSQTNSVLLKVSERVGNDKSITFLIKFGVTGCPDLVPPANGWIRRINDQATVTCNSTGLTWHLVCRGTSWIGQEAANHCEQKASHEEGMFQGPAFPTYGLLTAVVTGVFIGAVCGFSLLGAVLWCKRRANRSTAHKDCNLQMIQDHLGIQGPPTETTEYDESAAYDPHYHHHHHHHPPPVYFGQPRTAQQIPQQFRSASSFQPPCKVHHRLENGEYGYTHVWEIAGSDGETKLLRHTSLGGEEGNQENMALNFSTYSPSSYNSPVMVNNPPPQNPIVKSTVSSFKPQRQDSLYGKDSSAKVCSYQSCSNPNQHSPNNSFVKLSDGSQGKAQTRDESCFVQHQPKPLLDHPSLLQDHVQKPTSATDCCENAVIDLDLSSAKSKDLYHSSACCTNAQSNSAAVLASLNKLENHYT